MSGDFMIRMIKILQILRQGAHSSEEIFKILEKEQSLGSGNTQERKQKLDTYLTALEEAKHLIELDGMLIITEQGEAELNARHE